MKSNFKNRIIGLKLLTFRPAWRLAILAILFLCLSFLKTSNAYPYLAPENYLVLDDPRQAATADFNGDGYNDLAVVNYRVAQVSILLNDGHGAFLPAVNYDAVGEGTNSITAADFDVDADIDLAVSNYSTDTIVILRNDGSGVFTFTPGDSYTTGLGLRGLTGIIATRLDANASFDLVVANSYNNTKPYNGSDSISVLLNNGDGTFAAAVDYAVDRSPLQIVSADFDGDGDNDLVVSSSAPADTAALSVLENNGDGTFAPGVGISGNIDFIAAGDFDGDTDIDLAGIDVSFTATASRLRIYENNGLNSFTFTERLTSYPIGEKSTRVISGNFDNIAGVDLAVSSYADNAIKIFHGNNNFTFTAAPALNTLPGPINLAAADFDNDNKLDFVSINKYENIYLLNFKSYSGNSVSVYRSGVIITPTNGNTFVREGGLADSYSVVLASAPTADVKVFFTYDDSATGIDLTDSLLNPILSGGFITFTTLNWNTPQIITITAPIDGTAEGQLTSTITHTVTSVGDGDYDGSLAPNMDVIVADNDQAGVTVDESGGATPGRTEVKEGIAADDSFSVVLETLPTGNVTINISHSTQIALSSSSLTFTSANWATPQTVTVTAPDDSIIEGTVQENISFSSSCADPLSLYDGGIFIPSIIVNIVDVNTLMSNPLYAGRMGDLNNDRFMDPVDVNYLVDMTKSERETNYGADINQDEFAGGGDATGLTAFVKFNNNLISNFEIIIAETEGSTNVTEGGATDTYNLYLRQQPSVDVGVTVSLIADGQVTTDLAQVIFSRLDYYEAQEIIVSAVDDFYVEGAHTGTITHTAASADPNYNGPAAVFMNNGVATPNVVVNITDNDTAGVIVTQTPPPFGTTDVDETTASSDNIFIRLTSLPSSDVIIDFSTPDGQTSVLPVSLTFTPINGMTDQEIIITAVDDAMYEASPHIGKVWGTMTSSDPNYNGIGSLDVNITESPPPDAMPSLSINDVSLLERDSGKRNFNFTVTLSPVSGMQTTVLYDVVDGTATVADNDYVALPQDMLIFNPGETTKTIKVEVNGDTDPELTETFYVNLSSPENATILAGHGQGVGTIANDDTSSEGGLGYNVMPATNLSCQPISNSSLDWTFNDNSTNEIGFRLYGVLASNAYLIKEVATDATHLCNYAGGAAASCRLINEAGLTTNTEYISKVSAYIAAEESFTGLVSCYTLANIPKQVIIAPLSSGILNLKLDPNDGNPANTEYAIKEITTGKYLQSDGNFSDVESWQTYEAWGGAAGIAVIGKPVPAVQIALTSSDPYNLAAKARNGDGVETDLGAGNGQPAPAAIKPNIVATKGVAVNLAKNWGFTLFNTAFASIDLNNNQRYVLNGLSWLLNIALLILGIFFIIGIVSTVKHLRKDYNLSMALAIIDSLIFQKPQHVYEALAVQNNNGVYSQVSYAKHKKMHSISKASLQGILAAGVLKALVLFVMMGGLLGLNHFSSAQSAPYAQSGSADVDDILSYRIDLTNNGTAAAAGIIVTDVLNSHLTYVSGSSKVNNVAVANTGNNLTFNVGALGINESANITFKAKVNTGSEGQTITNQAIVSGSNITSLKTNSTSNLVSSEVIPPVIPPVTPKQSVCGNSIVEAGENCDNSACSTGNECLNCQCQPIVIPGQPVCGNSRVEIGEDCDNSSCSLGNECSNCQCQPVSTGQPVCGNGLIETGEGCDITGCAAGFACTRNCTCQPEEELPINTNQTPGEEPPVVPGIITPETPIIGPLITELKKIEPIKTISEVI
ncbi:MAG: FG-GAP-like repeat-containing protein, partial [Candidatus Parcubacteria bacterium]|nr:FG-GAP-like repeat-containing protein [Candidatus Parcubacteria bacterium]